MEYLIGQKLSMLLKGQSIWFILVLILAGLFAYGEIKATRLFNDTPTENWSPIGTHAHSSNIHHK